MLCCSCCEHNFVVVSIKLTQAAWVYLPKAVGKARAAGRCSCLCSGSSRCLSPVWANVFLLRCWPCLIPCSPTAAAMRHVKLVPTFKKLCRPTFLQKTSLDENRRGLDLLMLNCKQLNHQIKIQIVKHDRQLKTRRCPLCLLQDTD